LAGHWKLVKYLIIDEYSMISREFLATLSKTLNVIFKHLNQEDHDLPFGGKRCALYFPSSGQDTLSQNAGSELYRQFTTVVLLKQQMRITDPAWQAVLERARHGKCVEADLKLLRPWAHAFLVTPRNAVRRKWNSAASRNHCKQTKRQLLISPAEDTKRGGVLSSAELFALAKRKYEAKRSSEDRTQLEDEIFLAKGMQVMLVTNIQTELDMANGARGTVYDILLDPREPN
ncbi:hypothetical protein M378DRAFT_46345, partial [Amanita muscaria Koide BX008]